MDDHGDLTRLYGPWSQRRPRDVAQLLEGYAGTWWIAGGWAIEAFTGLSRPHGDLDFSVPREDVAALQRHLEGRFDVWAADTGTLRPLIEPLGRGVPRSCENLWLRRSGSDPWEYDVILMDVSSGVWTDKRHGAVRRPLVEILRTADGLRCLRPEVQLLHKAPGLRRRDEADFDACVPLLDRQSRSWLTEALRIAHPEHPWLERLERCAP